MTASLQQIIESYDPSSPLTEAWTIPAAWYIDPRISHLERRAVFGRSWQMVGRAEQVREPGKYITSEVGGEPILVVRGNDSSLRGFFNVCRHHAASVMNDLEGTANKLRCPYHGWTYSLEGELKGAPDFAEVCNFDRAAMGLVPMQTAIWENWVFVKVDRDGPTLEAFVGADLTSQFADLRVDKLRWMEQRRFVMDCNWKVFVDNYLDGGYHVPYLHKGLDSVLDYSKYTVSNGARFCLQTSPVVSGGADTRVGEVRKGERALYYWVYPNFMINWYEGVMDTNLVVPLGVDRTEVIFDFYFEDGSEQARDQNLASIAVGLSIQDEDTAICRSVQRGLSSRAYQAGRLSVRREAGEHLFHKLLYADLKAGLEVGQESVR